MRTIVWAIAACMAWETSGFSMPSVLPVARLGHGSSVQSRSPRLGIPLSSRGARSARLLKMQDGGLEGEEVRPEIKTKGSKSHGTDVVVIGAGLGGLSAGALLAKYGYKVTVCESHYHPGGCAHGFEIKSKKGGCSQEVWRARRWARRVAARAGNHQAPRPSMHHLPPHGVAR